MVPAVHWPSSWPCKLGSAPEPESDAGAAWWTLLPARFLDSSAPEPESDDELEEDDISK